MVYAVNRSDVVTPIVNGQVLVEDRVLNSLDVAEVMAEATRIAEEMTP
jgi:hypothetical protein